MAETDLEIRTRGDEGLVDRLRKQTNYPATRIMIVSTPRTASTYFCGNMANHGLENLPAEFFSLKWGKQYMRDNSLSMTQYVSEIVKGEINFSVNVMLHHYQYWKMVGYDLTAHFNKFIYLYRDDEYAQAVSRAIARKTDFWSSYSATGWGASKARAENNIEEYTPLVAEIDYEIISLRHEKQALSDFTFDASYEFNDIINDTIFNDCQSIIGNC